MHFGFGFASQKEAAEIAKEMHSRIVHKFSRRKVLSNKIDKIYGEDLIDFSKSPIYYNKKRYTYILVIVDVFSKYCWVFVIANKSVG